MFEFEAHLLRLCNSRWNRNIHRALDTYCAVSIQFSELNTATAQLHNRKLQECPLNNCIHVIYRQIAWVTAVFMFSTEPSTKLPHSLHAERTLTMLVDWSFPLATNDCMDFHQQHNDDPACGNMSILSCGHPSKKGAPCSCLSMALSLSLLLFCSYIMRCTSL